MGPVSYWRFELPGSLGVDTAGAQPLKPTAPTAWNARSQAEGGIVGGYAAIENATLAAAGGLFPRTSGASGVTLEMLIKTGPYFQFFGNTTLFSAPGPGGWIEAAVERRKCTIKASNLPFLVFFAPFLLTDCL